MTSRISARESVRMTAGDSERVNTPRIFSATASRCGVIERRLVKSYWKVTRVSPYAATRTTIDPTAKIPGANANLERVRRLSLSLALEDSDDQVLHQENRTFEIENASALEQLLLQLNIQKQR